MCVCVCVCVCWGGGLKLALNYWGREGFKLWNASLKFVYIAMAHPAQHFETEQTGNQSRVESTLTESESLTYTYNNKHHLM